MEPENGNLKAVRGNRARVRIIFIKNDCITSTFYHIMISGCPSRAEIYNSFSVGCFICGKLP
jgi:hypothetical protein